MGRSRDDERDKHSRHGTRHSSRSPSREHRHKSRHGTSSRSKHRHSSRDEDRHERRRKKRDGESRHSSHNTRQKNGDTDNSEYRTSADPLSEAALGKKFVWKKKVEQDKAKGLSREEREEAERLRHEEAQSELVNLRKRREIREIEQKQREEDMARQRREKEQEKLGDWERREEEFHLQQAKRRAEIRIKEHRPKAIDILAMNLRLANEEMDDSEIAEISMARIDVDEPHKLVEELDDSESSEFLQEVEMYLSLENNAQNVEFWENMAIVAGAHLSTINSNGGSGAIGGSSNNNRSEMQEILTGKSLHELSQLEGDVQAKLSGEQGAVDVDYWEQVRKELVVEKAKATLTEMHADILERRLKRVQQARSETANPSASQGNIGKAVQQQGGGSEVEQRKRQRLEELQRRILEGHVADEDSGIGGGRAPEGRGSSNRDIGQEMYEAEMRKEQDPGTAMFSVEATMPTRTYAWQDKHRPRKPRYFNRVHTGYEWNKYNQTHYDKDNPPPKVVQGYKFNIFYPDLIDRTKAPTYKVERDPTDDETCVLRFSAGPPYEDIAFRIVNREWEYNRRRGFRNTFDRGVLQLHFRFKRHYYRR
ncbi:hypothetical protein COEREDRAFT_69021 [Coemansia reversa NRRL 1564]|uniref:Splicing factor Cactin n=1 Tax=Coemansia reversa (strain ATCC 12441 / NRRL 1564) TaxID=763665 RepID=A0A2G5BJX6_COERN|nr:hypothetical protein COEREDRAFT_69021 [Coemansia reversa NRRL 1564]|eukprot:PIA19310.1 hypothetical protein COEREDRAFT_69021 [Coemansia reversa NRRL 1564]